MISSFLVTLLKALPMCYQRAPFFGLQKQLRSVLAGDLFQQDPHVRCGLFFGYGYPGPINSQQQAG
jgi:hypothetical protein